jgi:LysM repeat protein
MRRAVCLAGRRNHARIAWRTPLLGYEWLTFVRTMEVKDVRPMRLRIVLATSLAATVAAALSAAPAGAAVPHVVAPGETLWSIAAANNLTTRSVAAFNGLSEDSQVVLGQTIQVPTTVEGYAALVNAGLAPADPSQASASGAAPAPAAAPAPDGTGAQAAGTTASSTPVATVSSGPAPQGHYKVRAGDTLSGLAASSGVSVDAMAAMNGLDPQAPLLIGTVIKLPSGAPAPPRAATPEPAQTVVPQADPVPTATRLGAADVQSVAALHGVSPSLAAAIAWQESGFNNGMVSSANARGVMQVMPGTWSYVQQNLADRALDPDSATDNVHAGVLYLKRLLDETGGDESAAIAGYYQGLASVRSRGMYDDTRQYVANVQALRARFGG